MERGKCSGKRGGMFRKSTGNVPNENRKSLRKFCGMFEKISGNAEGDWALYHAMIHRNIGLKEIY